MQDRMDKRGSRVDDQDRLGVWVDGGASDVATTYFYVHFRNGRVIDTRGDRSSMTDW
jgi:hypothetical protein